MEWKDDPEVMDNFTQLLTNQKEDLGIFLESLHAFNDGSPLFQFLQIYGMFVFRFTEHLQKETELDALGLTIGDISNHPTVQGMVASMVQTQVHRGLNLE